MLKKLVRGLITIVLSIAVIIICYFAFMTVTDYKPLQKEAVTPEQGTALANEALKRDTPITAMIFNIGYCGLDKGQDFFLDGGTMSRSSSKEQTQQNLEAITSFLTEKNPEFVMLQEVDIKASRSFGVNQYEYIKNKLDTYETAFAVNYKVPWVPVPITHPMGSVNGGIITLSKYKSTSAARYSLPGKESWPRQLAELDRCILENRIPVEGSKELVLINLHLSAYDKGGKIRKQQLEFLKEHIMEEYNKGNYVILGGDWNHNIPGSDPKAFKWEEEWPSWNVDMPEDFLPQGFQWVFDKTAPTVRQNSTAYKEGYNFVAVIDGLAVSDNVEIIKVEGQRLNFENSDHNPVIGTFKLK